MIERKEIAIDDILKSILRGAAKILGCNSANLLIFNKARQEVKIQIGLILDKYPELEEVERRIGLNFNDTLISFKQARQTPIFQSWLDRTITETGSLYDLVNGAFPGLLLKAIDKLIGEHRFICIPVIGDQNIYGVLLYEKRGAHPFSAQQREILIRYARRIGEILENNTRAVFYSDLQRTGERRDSTVQNQLLQIALDTSAPALLLDPEFRITSCTEATLALLGFAYDDLLNKDIGMLFPRHQSIHTILNHQFLFLSDGHYEEATSVIKKDGEEIPCRVEALLLADEKDMVVGFVVLIRHHPEDEARMREMGSNAGIARQERLASMGEMAAQLAHEIRNPILAIGATLESLSRDGVDSNTDRKIFATLSKEITRLDMVLKDYLSLAVRRNTSVIKLNLREIIDEVSELLMGMQKMAGKKIEHSLPEQLVAVTDYEGMKHVLFNLFLNALEASPPDGHVVCSAEETKENITIYIDDDGPGLSSEPVDYFAAFYTTKKNGTGLGLTVCRRIITSLGGTVSIANRPGGGCRATIVLQRRTTP